MEAQARDLDLHVSRKAERLSEDPSRSEARATARLRPLIVAMRDRLRTIELSRFWWLRNRFFDLKRRLRFSSDGAWPTFEIPAEFRILIDEDDPYASWIAANEPTPAELARMRTVANALRDAPQFALLLTGDATSPGAARTLRSLAPQVYRRWRVVASWGDFADEDFVAWIRAGDALSPHALFAAAGAIANEPEIDVLYTDEDAIDERGARSRPFFKPEYGVESLLSRPYFGDLTVYRARLLREVDAGAGGDPVSAYDRALRAVERARRIVHVPEIAYHRAGGYVPIGALGVEPIAAAAKRRGESVHVTATEAGTYVVRYARANARERVSIVMPTRDHGEDVDRALRSIFERSTFRDFELILVDNGSRDPVSLATFARWADRDSRVRLLPIDIAFNYSRLNNLAVREAVGDVLILLNNDTEIVTPDWIESMLEQAGRSSIGAVGATLRFPDRRLQHAGVVMGLGGVAGHGHRGAPEHCDGYFGVLRAISNVSAVTGACLMVRKNLYEQMGGLDERLTVAFNDIDFCLRVADAGFRNVVLPHVEIYHGESLSRGHDVGLAKRRRSMQEGDIMRERWGRIIENDPFYSPHLTRRDESYTIRVETSF